MFIVGTGLFRIGSGLCETNILIFFNHSLSSLPVFRETEAISPPSKVALRRHPPPFFIIYRYRTRERERFVEQGGPGARPLLTSRCTGQPPCVKLAVKEEGVVSDLMIV